MHALVQENCWAISENRNLQTSGTAADQKRFEIRLMRVALYANLIGMEKRIMTAFNFFIFFRKVYKLRMKG